MRKNRASYFSVLFTVLEIPRQDSVGFLRREQYLVYAHYYRTIAYNSLGTWIYRIPDGWVVHPYSPGCCHYHVSYPHHSRKRSGRIAVL